MLLNIDGQRHEFNAPQAVGKTKEMHMTTLIARHAGLGRATCQPVGAGTAAKLPRPPL